MISKNISAVFLASALLSLCCATYPVTAQRTNAEPPAVQMPVFPADTFNILSFGAKGNGVYLNTRNINDAIQACHQKGGGVVLIPQGMWLTGPVVLESNVNLHVDRGALLLFTRDFTQYPLIESNYEGRRAFRCQSPISGKNLENVAITGSGVIDGSGGAWRMVKKGKLTASQWDKLLASGGVVSEDGKTWYPSEKSLKGSQTKDAGVAENGKTAADMEGIKDYLRPNLVSIFSCKKVLLEGVTFQNSPAWCLHPMLTEDLTVRNIYAKNPWYAQNGDGIDVESCKNVLIEGSTFDVGDDGICMKSGRDEEGRKRNAPTENVTIRNCVVYHAHGGFVIGSEMSGGVRNITVTDCSFIGTDVGLRFKTTRGRGGVVENIYISNINMRDISGDAIRFDMYYAAQDPVPLSGEKRSAPKEQLVPVNAGTPRFRDFHISHVYCNGAARAVFIRGLPEMNIKNITMDAMILKAQKGMSCIQADSIHLQDVELLPTTGPVIALENSKHITFSHLTTQPDIRPFMIVSGADSKKISLRDGSAPKESGKIRFINGATEEALH